MPERATAVEIRDAVASKRASAAETVRDALIRLERIDPTLRAFVQVFGERAMQDARGVDERLARGECGLPLAGVPVALKDNLCLDHGRTTCASRMLESYESPFTATAAQRLIDAGAIVIGKTNLDEFAMGSSTEHSCFGPTRNPWDPARVPGGSSGGSAAAVAAGVVPLALGSDTGGSIRQPAALCGVVGLKPTYGRVSRYGLVAFASSLDQVGPIASCARDAALALGVIAGPDPRDATSSSRPAEDWLAGAENPIEGLTLGVPRQARSDSVDPAMAGAFEAALGVFRSLGARLVDVDLPHADHAIAAYYIVAPAEASSNLARFDGVRFGRRAESRPGEGLETMYRRSRGEGFGAEVQRRIMLGTHVLSVGYHDAFYVTALRARRLIKRDYDLAFAGGCHAIVTPTTPGPAFRLGEKTGDPLSMYLEDVFTVGVSLAGLPAISIPAGFARVDERDLPLGLQIIAPAFEEGLLLRAARMYERATDWGGRVPPAA